MLGVVDVMIGAALAAIAQHWLPLLAAGVFALIRPARRRWTLRSGDDLGHIGAAVGLAWGLSTALTAEVTSLLVVAVTIVALWAGRAVAYAALRSVHRRRRPEPILAVGGSDKVAMLTELADEHPELGISIEPALGLHQKLSPSGMGDIGERVRAQPGRRCHVLLADGDRSVLDALIVAVGPDVAVSRLLTEPGGRRAADDELWGLPVAHVQRSRRDRDRCGLVVKRAIDIALAAVALVLVAPILAVVAIGVKRSSPGPVLFRQERVGRWGGTFELLKFRSLPVGQKVSWSGGNASTPTRFGKFIRGSCLDELPQLWNVLRGDMALIGPRPELPNFVRQFEHEVPGYPLRHRVRPGMTGWAQVHGLRGNTSLEQRVRFDNLYIESWSPLLDLRIVAATANEVARSARTMLGTKPVAAPPEQQPDQQRSEQETVTHEPVFRRRPRNNRRPASRRHPQPAPVDS